MSDYLHYLLTQAETQGAAHALESYSRKRELCMIKERLAEIKSQYEPLHTMSGNNPAVRALMYAAAFYVVVGRWPKDEKDEA